MRGTSRFSKVLGNSSLKARREIHRVAQEPRGLTGWMRRVEVIPRGGKGRAEIA
jgi:hypothetical protein